MGNSRVPVLKMDRKCSVAIGDVIKYMNMMTILLSSIGTVGTILEYLSLVVSMGCGQNIGLVVETHGNIQAVIMEHTRESV